MEHPLLHKKKDMVFAQHPYHEDHFMKTHENNELSHHKHEGFRPVISMIKEEAGEFFHAFEKRKK